MPGAANDSATWEHMYRSQEKRWPTGRGDQIPPPPRWMWPVMPINPRRRPTRMGDGVVGKRNAHYLLGELTIKEVLEELSKRK